MTYNIFHTTLSLLAALCLKEDGLFRELVETTCKDCLKALIQET